MILQMRMLVTTTDSFFIFIGDGMTTKTGVSLILASMLTALHLICIELSFGQTTAVPFLLNSSSPESNGQGTASVSRQTDDPFVVNFNPAHLGGMQNNFSVSFYPTKTNWLPGLGLKDLTYNSYVFCGKTNLKEYVSVPLSIGIAYSRVDLNLGTFNRTSAAGPDVIGIFNGEEHNDAMSLGVGWDIGIKLAMGITFRRIVSNLEGGVNASAWSRDYGLLMNVPIAELITKKPELIAGIAPLFDFSFGTALTNMDGTISYFDKAQADPLPRNISIGTSIVLGLNLIKIDSKIITFSWSRQADNILVGRNQDGSSYYRGIFGDLSFGKNIIQGKWTDAVKISQGWQIGLGEFIYIRQGSYQGGGFNYIKTDGLGISTSGLFKFLSLGAEGNTFINQFADHFDLHYDQSNYDTNELDSPSNSTKFSSLSLFIKF
jgi:hypothetical protein